MSDRRTRVRIRFRLIWVFALTALVAACLGYRGLRLNYLSWQMQNSDLVLDGGGFQLETTGATRAIVEEFGLEARDVLKSKLTDPDRFASAHVALIEITGVNLGGSWSGHEIRSYSQLNYRKSNSLLFDLKDNSQLHDWWVETVGDNLGIPIVEEETNRLSWLSR